MSVFESLLNNTFTVSRRERVSDGQGGWTIVYNDVDPVLGRIRPVTGAEAMVAQSEERRITHVLYTVADVDVARGDVVTCGNLTVEILGIREPSFAGAHWEIDCLERTDETSEAIGS